MGGKTIFKNSNVKVLFSDHFFKKNNLLVKALKPPFCSAFFYLKQRYFFHEKNCNIDYSSSLHYLIDVNWLYIWCKVTKKASDSSKQDDCYLVLLEAVV